MGTALARSESQPDIARKADAYGVTAEVVDGMDVVAVEAAIRRAAAAARAGNGPRLMECRTYRFRAHSMFDPQLYRDKAEVEAEQRHGPLVRFIGWLKEAGVIHGDEIDRLEREITAEIAEAVDQAETADWEAAVDLTRDVYAAEAAS
jgi:TPP-dependent pyruvate/acetoin dehydrogenase alpha subunit